MKRIFTIFLFLVSIIIQSQTWEDLVKMTDYYIQKTKYQEALELNIQHLKKSKNERNKEVLLAAYINIGKLFCELNEYNESLKYFDLAKKDIENLKNPFLEGRLYLGYGTYYSRLDLDLRANKNFNKAIQYLRKAKDSELTQNHLFTCYISKWGYFEYVQQADSSLIIQKQCLREFPNEPMAYNLIAYRYIYSGTHTDSIKYYLDKANSLSPKGYHRGALMLYYGEYYTIKDDFPKALEYYFQALEIFKQTNRQTSIIDAYKRIKLAYGYLKNKEKDEEYAAMHSKVEKEVKSHKKKAVANAVEKLLEEQKREEETKRNQLYGLIFSMALLSFLMIYFLRRVYVKKQKAKDELLNKKRQLLEKKNRVIDRKSIETKRLKKKVNEIFDRLIQMAKDGDPFFLTKFKEVYPEFHEKLITNYPDLTELDLKFCAYLKLNLNNKEIMQYENVTLRAIETRRYRLKKKLGLSSDVDIAKWILEL